MSRGKSKRRRNRSTKTPRWVLATVGVGAIIVGVLVVAALNSTRAPASTYVRPPQAAVAEPPAPAPRPNVVFLGDSYTAGAGSSGPGKNFVAIVGKAQGWNVTNLGRGGTGYVGTSSMAGCGLDYCPNYSEMIAEAIKVKPSIIVVSGGRNDGTRPGLAKSISAFYTQLRTAFPNATIIATSPIWDDDPAPASIEATRGYVSSAVTAVGGTFLDIGEPLSGRTDFIAPDGVHPNDAGYAAIASAIGGAI